MQMKRVVDLSCIKMTYPRHLHFVNVRNFRHQISSVLSFGLSKTIIESIPNQTPKQTKYSQEKFVSNSNMQTTRVVDLSCKQ